jgi:hypothetical protein
VENLNVSHLAGLEEVVVVALVILQYVFCLQNSREHYEGYETWNSHL